MAKATVIHVTQGKMKDQWPGYFFKYQPDPYKGQIKDPVEKFVFGNNKEIVAQIQNLEAGDYVEIRQEKDNKGYWQIVGVAKLQKQYSQNGNDNTQKGNISTNFNKKFVENTTNESIQKQVCLKEASAIVQCLITNDRVFKKTEKPDLIADAVVSIANMLNGLFTGKGGLDDVVADDSDLVKKSDEDAPFNPDDDIPFD